MLKLENVSKYYSQDGNVNMALRRINLEFKIGEFVAVTGESGSGKSTFLNVISGIDTYEEGELFYRGAETSHYTLTDWENFRRGNISFIFQDYNLIDSFTVYKNIEIALLQIIPDKKERHERVMELINKVGLQAHVKHKASRLSGGQKQRVIIARALAEDCPILLADEPTGNLDSESGKAIVKLIKEVSADKLVIVVTHDYEDVADYATRHIRFYDGEVAEDKELLQVADAAENEKLPHAPLKKRQVVKNCIKVAAMNCVSQPKRAIYSLIFMTIAVLLLSMLYSATNSLFDDGEYNYYGNYQYRGVERLDINMRSDGDAAELKAMLNDLNVSHVYENYNHVFDSDGYAALDFGHYAIYGSVKPMSMFLKDNPVLDVDKLELIAGSATGDKPVIVLQESVLDRYSVSDDVINELLVQVKHLSWGSNYLELQFGAIYLHGESGVEECTYFIPDTVLNEKVLNDTVNQDWSAVLEANGGRQVKASVYVSESLKGREVFLSYDMIESGSVSSLLISNGWEYNEVKNVTFVDLHGYQASGISDSGGTVNISPELAAEIGLRPKTVTAIFTGANVSDIKRISEKLEDGGYATVYPHGYERNKSSMTYFMNMASTAVTIIAGFVIFGVIMIFNRRMVKKSRKDFTILRALGYNRRFTRALIFIENLTYILIAFVITVIANIAMAFSEWGYIIASLSFASYMYILLVVVGITLIMSIFSSRAIFAKSVNKTFGDAKKG